MILRFLATKSLIGLIYLYQYAVSPWLGPRCRFYPSCSCYALQALKTQSFWFALWIILCRLVKCHPWHLGGYDPVPQKRTQKWTSDDL